MSSTEDKELLDFIRKTFLEEADFLLSDCEEALLNLGELDKRKEALGQVFRIAHSFKGSGATAQYFDLATFAHSVEDCLSALRAQPEKTTNEIISLLLKSFDLIKNRIEDFKAGDEDNEWDVHDIIQEIQKTTNILEGKNAEPNLGDILVAGGAATQEDLDSALEKQQNDDQNSSSHKKIGEYLVEDKKVDENVINTALKVQNDYKEAAVKANQVTKKSKPQATQNSNTATTLKISSDRIDSVMDLAGELVVIKSQILESQKNNNGQLESLFGLLDKTVREIYEKTLSMRMTSLKSLFLKLQRQVFDLSNELNKTVDLETTCDETELDRSIIEKIGDPLIHIVRNSLDHGLKPTEERIAVGKPETGNLKINAFNQGSNVIIEIIDDGRGISKSKIIEKALSKNLISDEKKIKEMTESEIFELIFAPGFSTAEKISAVSGRGVGMDVVKTNIKSIKGNIEIKSEEGEGTVIRLIMPLTTAITDGVVILFMNERFVIPIEFITELIPVTTACITYVDGQGNMLDYRGNFVPLRYIHNKTTMNKLDSGLLAVVESDNKLAAIYFDKVIGQSQVVIKSMGKHVGQAKGFTGAAILGDGNVSLVIDVNDIVKDSSKSTYDKVA